MSRSKKGHQMILTHAVAAAIALGCAGGISGSQRPTIPVLPSDLAEPRTSVEHLALQIYAHDIAAWRATDAVVQAGLDPEAKGVSGWITLLDGSEALVRFVGEGPAGPSSLIDVRVDVAARNPGLVTLHSTSTPLTSIQTAMWRARRLAAQSSHQRCSDRYNTVVFRDPDSEDWLVYLLAATLGSDLVVGGHHRFRVSPLGDEILEATPLSLGCLAIPRDPDAEAFVFTQNASDSPLETSVLLSLQIDTPVAFVTRDGAAWMATQGHLFKMREGPGE